MATRFYFPTTGTPSLTPSFDSNWEQTSAMDRVEMVTSKISSSFASKADSETTGSRLQVGLRQYISDKQYQAYSFSGTDTWKLQVRGMEDNPQMYASLAVVIKVIQSDGSLRGVLATFEIDDNTLVNGTLTNRSMSGTCNSVSMQDGDHIMIELGADANNTKTTSYTATLEFGDNSGSDLPEDDSDTNQYCPWLELSPTLSEYEVGYTLVASGGSYAMDGQVLNPLHNKHLDLGGDSYAVIGQALNPLHDKEIVLSGDAYSITGQTLSLVLDRLIPLGGGTYVLTGSAITLIYSGDTGYTIEINPGNYVVSGQDINLLIDRLVQLGSGSFAVTGQTLDLLHAKKTTLESGSYIVTGQDVSLLRGYKVMVNPGGYALTGQILNLLKGYKVIVESGSYLIAGQDIGLLIDRIVQIDSGSYILTGQSVTLSKGRTITIESGNYALAGQILNLLQDRKIVIDTGSYLVDGYAIDIIYQGEEIVILLNSSLTRGLGFNLGILTEISQSSSLTKQIDLESKIDKSFDFSSKFYEEES